MNLVAVCCVVLLLVSAYCLWTAFGWVNEAQSHREETNRRLDEFGRRLEHRETLMGKTPLPRPSSVPPEVTLPRPKYRVGWARDFVPDDHSWKDVDRTRARPEESE